ncbi:MAG: hypothetical protein V2A78_07280 [bacterium]
MWMKLTGGINEEPYEMHIDHAEPDRVEAAVDKWFKEVSRNKRERSKRGKKWVRRFVRNISVIIDILQSLTSFDLVL